MEKIRFDKPGTHEVGTIVLNNEVYITDPCYDTDTWCQKLLTDVSPGKYKCFVVVTDEGKWGNRVSELLAVKEEMFDKYGNFDKVPYCCIGVDSGQCGFFDAKYYEEHQPDDDYNNLSSWYRKVCELSNNAGTIDGLGVVAMSGYGDGGYPLFVAKENGQVVAMKVVFIGFEDEEE